MRRNFSNCCLLLAGLLLMARPANAQFDELARYVPSSANALVVVNVEKLMATPAAKTGRWAERRDTAFASGISFLPPDSKRAVLAKQFDLQMGVPLWEAAVLQIDHEPSMEKVVELTGGSLDKVANLPAVGLPEDAFVVKLGVRTAAFMAPANRQSVVRWMQEVLRQSSPQLSPYLTEAYAYANEIGTPVILSLDLEDALPLNAIKARLAEPEPKEFLAANKLDSGQVAQMLSGLRGLTLGITFTDKPFGKVKVDFRDNVPLSPQGAKAALVFALGIHGAMIDEFETWTPKVAGKQYTLEGNLGDSGIRRISSLFDRPPSLREKSYTPQEQAKSKEQLTVEASQAYFKKVVGLLDDLKETRDSSSNRTLPQIATWMNKYASKIDQLSVLHVDPELADYGAQVAEMLRGAYAALQSGAAQSRIRQANTEVQSNYYTYGATYGYTYRYGADGAWGTVAAPDIAGYKHEMARIRTEERTASGNQARDIVQGIKSLTAETRRKMTQKYEVDF
jgi:hypothetical protein